jgi:hypothetical protein
MNKNLFRAITLGVLCASFIGASTAASAYGWGDGRQREIHRAERKIDHLRAAKDRALNHHNWQEARRLQAAIDRQKAIIRSDRAWRH